jgi:hypothetical protein
MCMKIGFYVRPWSYKYFKYMASLLGGHVTPYFVSDFKGLCKGDLSTEFYAILKNVDRLSKVDISHLDGERIVSQDRLLRTLPHKDAINLIKAAHYSILKYLQKANIDTFISVTIDSYIIDLIELNCKRLNIKFIGIHLTMISGYTLITARGESNSIRNVDIKELSKVYKKLTSSDYSVNYVENKNPPFSLALKRWIKSLVKIPYFEIARRYRKDPLNYHYLSTIAVSRSRSNIKLLRYKSFFCEHWEESVSSKLLKIYMPIQFHPECNSEYWSTVQKFLPYEKGFLSIVKELNQEFQIIVKEHPEMIGLRDSEFYRSLKNLNNVTLVPVGVSQDKLIDICDVCATWNSSVGIESILRNKPVITFASPFYSIGNCYLNIKDDVNLISEVKNFLGKDNNITHDQQKTIIKHILSTSILGHPDEIFFDIQNHKKVSNAQEVAHSLKDLLSL